MLRQRKRRVEACVRPVPQCLLPLLSPRLTLCPLEGPLCPRLFRGTDVQHSCVVASWVCMVRVAAMPPFQKFRSIGGFRPSARLQLPQAARNQANNPFPWPPARSLQPP